MHKDLKVFVINLVDDTNKRERIRKILSNFSFEYKFFEACDGRRKKQSFFKGYNDLKRKLFFGRSLLPKELGIFESHKNILQNIIKNNYKYALIFEDDISINYNFEKYLVKILSIKYEWELIRFLDNPKLNNKGRKILHLGENIYLKRYPNLFGGAHAYLISLNGAKKILDLTKNYYYPIDLVMGQTWKNNLNSLICNPGMVWQEASFNIDPPGSQRFIKKRKNKLSLYPFTRFVFKIYESLSKWTFYIFKFIPDFFSKNY